MTTQQDSGAAQSKNLSPRPRLKDQLTIMIKITGLINLPYDTAIPLLGIHPEETRTEKDTCTPMFTAALFTVARTWKQHRCPLADEWKRKLWYIHTMEYYSGINRHVFKLVLMKWMNLEPVIQSKISQKEKDKYDILTHIYGV